jgi:hypothetical protein
MVTVKDSDGDQRVAVSYRRVMNGRSITIVMEDDGVRLAERYALKRQTRNTQLKRRSAHGHDDTTFEKGLATHRAGSFPELAAALLTSLPWHAYMDDLSSRGSYRPPDLGRNIQIRGRTELHYGLIVHRPKERDNPEDIFVLAYWDRQRSVMFAGWMFGWEAQNEKYWNTVKLPRPAYLIDKDCPNLRPIGELLRGIEVWSAKKPVVRASHNLLARGAVQEAEGQP